MSSTRTGDQAAARPGQDVDHHAHDPSVTARLAMAWTFVGVPLAYGIFQTVKRASALF